MGAHELFRRGMIRRTVSVMIRTVVSAAIIGLCIWAATGLRIDVERLGRGLPAIANIITRMIPDRNWLWPAIEAMGHTFAIALIGTTMGALLALPVALLAARNVVLYRIVAAVGRQLSNAIRSFPEIILGVFFVASYGPGPTAGALAIGVHSIGMLARMYADTIENVDSAPAEALIAAGATKLQVFRFAILPQVLPELIATALYRFEINLRSANVLGLVGAGGIGVILLQALTLRRWGIVGACLLVIIIVVSFVDYGSAWLRKKLV